MIPDWDYAVLSASAYRGSRDDINQIEPSAAWSATPHPRQPSGFEATVYSRPTSDPSRPEIVIAIAGSNEGVDWLANVSLFSGGVVPDQLYQAARLTARVTADNPTASISITGHSLGGGLAALLGVFFDVPAGTFNAAPFYQTASKSVASLLMQDLQEQGLPVGALSTFDSNVGTTESRYVRGESNVRAIHTQGEAVWTWKLPPFAQSMWLGAQIPENELKHGSDLGAFDLHSVSLAAALENSAFRHSAQKLPNLLPLLFDKNLYSFDLRSPLKNLLDQLIQKEVATPDRGSLSQFSLDVAKVASVGGLAVSNGEVNKALLGFAMQYYYTHDDPTLPALFDVTGGGVHFSMYAMDPSMPPLADIKGYKQYFEVYLENKFLEVRSQIITKLSAVDDWYVAGRCSRRSCSRDASARA